MSLKGKLANSKPSGNGKAKATARVATPAVDDPPGTGDPDLDPPEVKAAAAARMAAANAQERSDAYEDPIPPTAPGNRKVSRFKFVGSAAFATGDYRPEWLIKNVLVRSQPGVIAGPSKALKTNFSIDMAVSLAAGVDLLGTFAVTKKTRVVVVSGESGEHTLQETAKRICRSKHVLLEELDGYLEWCFTLPTFSDLAGMNEFADGLAALNAEVVIIDPVYLALGNIDAKNLFEAGAAFRIVAEVLLKAGCTPILIHHANRQLTVGEPMELTHLAYSGLEQFARQFVLLNRRVKYAGDGVHDLWATIGGSAGHGGLWNLNIKEGKLDDNFSGREWNVTVQTLDVVKENQVEQRESVKREKTRAKDSADEKAILAAIDYETRTQPGATRRSIKESTGLSTERVRVLLESLIDAEVIEEVEFQKTVGNGAERAVIGFRQRDSEHREHRESRCSIPGVT
jgi:hypothetical protein